MKRYVNGFEINGHPKTWSGGDPSNVTVSKLGASGSYTVMTPAETRALAAALNAAADEAEAKPS